jgi:GTP-binding protein
MREKIPNIAIIGRPNVGKSTLFNALIGRRIAIEDFIPGTTRDRISAILHYDGLTMVLVDTGGLEFGGSEQRHWTEIQKQINIALKEADLVLFVVDIRSGVTDWDIEISKTLRSQNKQVILCLNKADLSRRYIGADTFRKLGYPDEVVISALQRHNLDVLLENIRQKIDPDVLRRSPYDSSESIGHRDRPSQPEQTALKIAIIGKQNVGKSTLVNTLAKQERMIVNEIPGTTRDSVDVRFERGQDVFIAIDTAGIRKKGKLKEAVDIYSQKRTETSIKRADVVIFLIDAQEKISEVDKKIASFIIENYKPFITTINKWDIVNTNIATKSYQDYLDKTLPFSGFAPIVFISAKTGFNLSQMMRLARELYNQAGLKTQTALLNKVIEKIKPKIPLLQRGARHPKIYYALQSGSFPPTFTFIVNDRKLFSQRATRFLEHQLRHELPIQEVPVKIILKNKTKSRLWQI